MSTEAELLERHVPLLRYDPQDLYRAISAEAAVSSPGNVLLDGDGEVIARAVVGDDDPPAETLDLALLGAYEGREDVVAERLAYAPGYAGAARRMQAPAHRFSGRVHGRVRHVDSGETWLQYWFYYYNNPKNLGGLGKHEGDWEMIQVHLDSDERPDRVTYAQHEFGEQRDWDQIETEGEHPIVYVGQLSHASYFERGSFPYAVIRRYLPFGIDHALGGRMQDGREGPSELPRVDQLDEAGWATWPGRWGSGERAITLIVPQGDGPPSPGQQEPKWGDPDRFDRRQGLIGGVIRRLVGGLLHFVGRAAYPQPVTLESASLDGDVVRVSFAARSRLLRRTKYVLLTVNEADGNQLVLASRTIRSSSSAGAVTFRVRSRQRGPLRVWASAYNGPRQRSEPTSIVVSG